MAVAFVNSGAGANQSIGTTLAPAMPASLVNGNLLLAIATTDSSSLSKTITVSGTGWTLLDSQGSTGVSSAVAWCIVNGSQTAPTFSWTGNASGHAQIFQYTGNASVTPTGAEATLATSGTTVTATAITTTKASSLIAILVGGSNGSTTIGASANYNQDSATTSSTGGNCSAFSETKASAGVTSDAFSCTVGSMGSNPGWVAYTIEILNLVVGVPSSSTVFMGG